MKVITIWATRKSEPNALPELLTAWDEWCIDGNWEGWEKDRQRALDSIGTDLAEWREIALSVPQAALNKAFEPVKVNVEAAQ